MSKNLREQYEKALQLGKLAFVARPYFGSPGAPAQAETNARKTSSEPFAVSLDPISRGGKRA